MFFHVQLIDYRNHCDRREISRHDHWQYFDDNHQHFVARGATLSDDGQRILSSVLFVEFDNFTDVKEFIENEPHNKNNVYQSVNINRWNWALRKLQRDFKRSEGENYWYIRGFGKNSMNSRREELLDEHREYFRPYDSEHFISRGPVLSDDGREWMGSANLIRLPSRKAVNRFLTDEPYYKNGLYQNVLVEKYKFGGRPGQVV